VGGHETRRATSAMIVCASMCIVSRLVSDTEGSNERLTVEDSNEVLHPRALEIHGQMYLALPPASIGSLVISGSSQRALL
jgi:hypothetical protein